MVDVRRVFVFGEDDIVHREVVLLRARISQEVRSAMQRSFPLLQEIERRGDSALLQFTGAEDEIEKLLQYLEPYGLIEFVRSGRIAVSRTGDYESDLSRSLHELRPDASVGPDM
jgi:acetolactate synthase-1/3 small subunit